MPELPKHISWDEQFNMLHPELSDEFKKDKEAKKRLLANLKALKEKAVKTERTEEAETLLLQLSPEELKNTQSLYDFLNLDYNIRKHIKDKGIDSIPKEQKEALEKEGYNYYLVVPGDIPRDEFLKQFQASFAKEFTNFPDDKSKGLYFYDNNYQETQSAKDQNHILRPPKPYQIALKLPKDQNGNLMLETSDVQHKDPNGNSIPELNTMDKTFPKCLEILKKINQNNPHLNLKGLTLPEYLIFQANIYHNAEQEGKNKEELANFHPDINDWTWLLEELILDNQGKPVRSLGSDWFAGARRVLVFSGGAGSAYSFRGVRFAAVSKKSSP